MIKVFNAFTDDFSGQGLGYIAPIRADIEEEARGMYEIEIELPIDESRDDFVIDHENIIAAPAPTRTSPEINFGISGTIERQIYKATGAVKMYNLSNRKKALKKYKKNAEFVRLAVDGDWYKVSAVKGGATGWVKAAKMAYSRAAEENVTGDSVSSIIETVVAREQYFRIYGIKRDTQKMRVTANAEHISYDLRGVICADEYAPEDIPADEAVEQIMARVDDQDHPFRIYCQCTTLISGDYSGRNIIDILLNAEDGIVTQCNARFVRDNFDLYILNPADRYTGADIRYGDNMIKAVQETDSAARIARIRPVGKNKDGDPLYITDNGGYVDSPYASNFAVKRTKQIAYAEAQTGKNGLKTDAQTRKRLAQLAAEEFEKGADGIAAKIDAEFVRKELAMEYADLANEAALHLYDVAHVRANRAGIVASVRMSAYKFSTLPGQERYTDTRITDLTDVEPMLYGGTIAPGSISGTAIRNGSIDGSQKIKDLTVGYGKFDMAAIDKLNANSITAITGAFNKIEVSDELYAAFANVVKLAAGSIESGSISTDQLAAVMADIVTLTAKTGEFDLATIKNLLAEVFNLEQGYAGTISITNLIVTSANLLNATVGKLVLKGPDGTYYRVFVGTDGKIQTEQVQPTDEEIEAGQTGGGQNIVETTVNAELIHGQTITGQQGNFNSILTQALNAGSITAQDAFIASATVPLFYTTAIKAVGDTLDLSANKTIQFVVGKLGEKSEIYRQDAMPDGAEVGDLWVEPSTGYTYQLSSDDIPENVLPKFSVNEAGELIYEFAEGQVPFEISINEDGDLVYSGTTLSLAINEDGEIYVKGQWVRVLDNDLYDELDNIKSNTITREEFYRFMRFDVDTGLTIGASNSSSELLLNEAGVSVLIGGQTYSKFAANYVQFGNYQIRKSANGALVFKLAPAEGSEGISALSLR